MPGTYSNYIDGEWSASDTGETIAVRNPADTDDVVGEFQHSSSEDAAEAIDAAAAAQEGWADTPAQDRGDVLRETARRLEDRKEELTETLTREEGKSLSEVRPEVQRAIDIFYYYAEKAPEFMGTVKAYGRDSNLYTVGGMNASSSETYREQGEAGMDFFTITKTVYENY